MSALQQLPVVNDYSADDAGIGLAARPETSLTALPGGRGDLRGKVAAIRSPLVSKSAFGLVFLSVTVLVISLVAVLVINTSVVNGSYEITRLNSALRVTNQDIQTKRELLRRTEATLPQRAAELGLEQVQGAQVINISRYVGELTNQITGGLAGRGER